MEKDGLQSTKLQGVTLPKFWAWASSHCCAKVNLLNGMYVWAQLDLGQHLLCHGCCWFTVKCMFCREKGKLLGWWWKEQLVKGPSCQASDTDLRHSHVCGCNRQPRN